MDVNSLKSGQKGPRGTRSEVGLFDSVGLNVLYDEAGNEYPVDDAGQLYVSTRDIEQTVVD